jgi:predicted nucleic acid-binding protein
VEPPLITLDTSGVLALLSRRDPAHEATAALLGADPGPYLVPAATLGEIGDFVESRLGVRVLDGFLADLAEGALDLDCGRDDFERIRELVARYDDLPLGLVDASVIACAERSGGRVLTLDVRDFGVVAREGTISIVP